MVKFTKKVEKFFWQDCEKKFGCRGEFLAGGILFYDDNGIWAIVEGKQKGIGNKIEEHTDFGGKYSFEDGHIMRCISRELEEESFGMLEIKTSELIKLSKNIVKGFVTDCFISGFHQYYCLVVHTDRFPHLKFDANKFLKLRKKVVQENSVDSVHYTSLRIEYIKFVDMPSYYKIGRSTIFNPSFRLKMILENCDLLKKIQIDSRFDKLIPEFSELSMDSIETLDETVNLTSPVDNCIKPVDIIIDESASPANIESSPTRLKTISIKSSRLQIL